MELKHIMDSVAFFKAVDSCRGEILLHTKEQDVLNLRSQLCRFIFAVAFSEGSFLEGARVECIMKSPLGDPVAYLVKGAVIALRREDAASITVVRA